MNKCRERSSIPFEFRFDFVFNLCYEFPLRFSGSWNNKFECFSFVLRSYEYGWWLDLCRIKPSRGLLYLVSYWSFFFYLVRRYIVFWSLFIGSRVMGTSNEESAIWNQHFAIEVDMESVE
ncbi:unnamed protein product [Brassica oleracea var. botrytis]